MHSHLCYSYVCLFFCLQHIYVKLLPSTIKLYQTRQLFLVYLIISSDTHFHFTGVHICSSKLIFPFTAGLCQINPLAISILPLVADAWWRLEAPWMELPCWKFLSYRQSIPTMIACPVSVLSPPFLLSSMPQYCSPILSYTLRADVTVQYSGTLYS